MKGGRTHQMLHAVSNFYTIRYNIETDIYKNINIFINFLMKIYLN